MNTMNMFTRQFSMINLLIHQVEPGKIPLNVDIVSIGKLQFLATYMSCIIENHTVFMF